MATYLWSTLAGGSTIAFNAASDVLNFDDPSIFSTDRGMLTWTGNDVVFSVSDKSNAALNKTIHLTVPGGGRALTDTNVIYANGSKLLIGDNTTAIGNGTSTFDDAGNLLTGSALNDRIISLGGNDTVDGGAGNDIIILNNGSGPFGADVVDGGAGLSDWIGIGNHPSIIHGVTIDFSAHMLTSVDGTAAFTNIENAFGTPANDTFIAFDPSRVYLGLGGGTNFDFSRSLEGYAGSDTFLGDARPGYFEIVTYAGAPNGVSVNLATGIGLDGYDSDAVTPGVQSYTDTLVNIDSVQGSPFDDLLLGGGPALTFSGSRFEQFEGMAGNDIINANGAPNTRATYLNSPAAVSVNLAAGTASDGWGGADTLIGIVGITGSNFNDTLVGDGKNNFIEGRGGNDTIDGGVGSDLIFFSSASGPITVDLATGSANLSAAGLGTDTWVNIEGVRGGDFNDTLYGANGVDNTLEGQAGADSLDGRSGIDLVRYDRSLNGVSVNLAAGTALDGYDSDPVTPGVQPYTDTLVSIESVRGSRFDDTLTGDANNNFFQGWAGNDTIDGGAGTDCVEYTSSPNGATVNLGAGTASDGWGGTDTLNSIENVTGSAFNDSLTGDAKDNFLYGGAGADYLNGGPGGDYADYRGSASALTVDLGNPANNTGEAAGDVFVSIERIRGSNFNDTLVGDGGNNTLRGGFGADTLDGGAGHDFASYSDATIGIVADLGNSANNTGEAAGDVYLSIESLRGGNFNDTLRGDGGSLNFLQGGPGADVLDGGPGFDYADYINSTIGITVDLSNPTSNTGEAAGDTFISIERVRGSAFNDTLIGDANSNTLRGGLGADVLNGGSGGFDYASYSDSSVGLTADLSNPANNTGEAAGDSYLSIEGLRGGNFNDTLVGDFNNNFLNGGPGGDVLNGGGAGFDFADYFDAATAVTVDLTSPQNNQGEAIGDTYVSIEGIRGGAFNDTLIGDSQINVLIGGAGGDLLNGGTAFGGTEVDFASYTNSTVGITANLGSAASNTGEAAGDIYVSIEGLIGSAFNDRLTGDGLNNHLRGNLGADALDGGAGFDFADYFESSAGLVIDLSNAANNTGEAAGDTYLSIEGLSGSNLNDTLTGDAADNFLRGRLGADVLNGGAGFDFADYFTAATGVTADLSNAANNTGDAAGDAFISIEALSGGAFNDILVGDAGDNYLRGRLGADVLNGGAGLDVADYRNSAAGITIDLANAANNTGEASGDSYISIEGLRGGDFDDTLRGNSGANLLIGGAGSDVADYINAAAGLVVDLSNPANNTGEAAGDTYVSIEELAGSAFNDTLTGDAGDNDLRGNGGADALNGGAGFDFANYEKAAAGVTADLSTPANNTGEAAGDTYVSIEGLAGSDFADTLTGDAGDNFFFGGLGNDVITGNAGKDTAVFTGGSIDYVVTKTATGYTVSGADGVDRLVGVEFAQFDDDTISLAPVVPIVGGDGSDTLSGSSAADLIDGGAGDDSLSGGAGADKLLGGLGNDLLDGGLGNDKLSGGVGDDVLIGGSGDNLLDGGAGDADKAIFDGALTDYRVAIIDGPNTSKLFFTLNGLEPGDVVTLVSKDGRINRMAGVEKVKFLGDDAELQVNRDGLLKNAPVYVGVNYLADKANLGLLKGTTKDDVMDGLDGNDLLTGLAGNDVLDGGSGDDTLVGGAGNDTYILDSLLDTVTELSGQGSADLVKTALAFMTLADKVEVERLEYTGTDAFTGVGNSRANVIKGGAGNDTLDGGAGADRMEGGAGDDTYTVDKGSTTSTDADGNVIAIAGDTVFEGTATSDSGGNDTVKSSVTYTLGVNVENLMLTGTANVSGTGNARNNVITGNEGNNALSGGGGNDTLDGGAGNDTLNGGAGDDTLIGSPGNDTYTGGAGSDTLDLSGLPFTFADKSQASGFLLERPDATTIRITDVDTGQKLTIKGAWGATSGDRGIETFIFSDQSGVTLDQLIANTASPFNDSYIGGDANDTFDGLAGNDTVSGGLGNDTLIGRAGNDVLDGGEGDDVLTGGLGNDTYVVDSSADSVTELLEQGTADLVKTTLSAYVLPENVERLEFTGAGNFTGTGNIRGNTLKAGAGNDVLDGGAGVDRMEGGAGDDIYYVDRGSTTSADADGNVITIPGDTVFEGTAAADSGGTDTVRASVSYTLTVNVENLVLTSAANLNGTGNARDNIITGNDGRNVLAGGAGNDTLIGGLGNDRLTGGADADQFEFNTLLDSAGNVDVIADFQTGVDRILLDSDTFASLADGALAEGAFYAFSGASTPMVATEADDRILYNSTTGRLYFDADGSGDAAQAIQFATLSTHPAGLSAADFLII